jgi:serine/threonine protein kinase/tetratricopeptide (TPR) repeat protein
MIGQTISHYKILDKLGEGGMGIVYRAHDTKLDRTVALKFLPQKLTATDEDKQRFIREAKAAAALNHPHICTIHNVDEYDGNQFIVMEYVDGVTLRDKLEIGNQKSETPATDNRQLTTVITYAIQIAEALQQAHKKNVVHRDIKPENIMVTEDDRIKVMDFGLAKLKGVENLTKSRSTVGTLGYMSPEQIEGGEVDHRSDIFSFGVVLYEMLTGQKPFRGEHEAAMVYSIVNEDPQPVQTYLPDAPPELVHILNRALEKDPADRYQSVDDILIDLRRLKRGSGQRPVLGIREHQSKPDTRTGRPALFTVKTAGAAIGVVLIAVIIVWFAFLSPSKDTATVPQERKMLVVLPFQNLGDSEMDYLVDGITDEITGNLTTLSGLGVIGRSSAYRYRNTTMTVREIADELGVTHIMEGTVRWERRPDGEILVRVNPQLIRVSDGTQVWAQSFDAVLSGVLALQSEVATQVANALDITLRTSERHALEIERTVHPEAYDYYLRGMQYHRRGYVETDFRIAIDLFKRAIDRDPSFSSAYAKLSRTYSSLYWFHYDRSDEILLLSESNARRAIELAPDLAEGYEALGWYYYHGLLDYERALREFNKALDLQPQNADLRYGIAAVKRRQGKFEESITIFEESSNLNPTDPVILFNTGETYWLMRNYDKALDYLDRGIKLAPDFVDLYDFKSLTLLQLYGDIERAKSLLQDLKARGLYRVTASNEISALVYLTIYERNYAELFSMLEANPQFHFNNQFVYVPADLFRALAYFYSDDRDNARRYFETVNTFLKPMIDENPDDPRLYVSMGITLAGLGQREEAIRHGVRAVEILPLSREAYRGAYLLEGLAKIYAMTGEHQKAIDALETLLSRPSHVNHVLLRLDPAWDPLRNEARFKKFISEER